MDVLKSLAFPTSIEHYHLLLLIGALVSVVLYPYLGFLLGTSFLSYRYDRKGRKEGNPLYVRFAKDLIETALINKTVPVFFALIPAFALVFIYAQLLQSTSSIAVTTSGLGFLSILAAIVLLYAYRYTFRLGEVLNGYREALHRVKHGGSSLSELEVYSAENVRAHLRFGRYGVVLAIVAAFLTASSMAVAPDPENWAQIDSLIDLLVSPDVYVRFLEFIALAAGATGVGVLFFLFWWRKDEGLLEKEYADFVRKICLRLILGSLLALPVLVLAGLFTLPSDSLSGTLYAVVGLALGIAVPVCTICLRLCPRAATAALGLGAVRFCFRTRSFQCQSPGRPLQCDQRTSRGSLLSA